MALRELDWFCATVERGERFQPTPLPTELLPMGVASKGSLWDKGTVLKVRFLGGAEEVQRKVLDAATAWFVPEMNLTLKRAEFGEEPQIRIAFDPKVGSWSYVGTECLAIHPSQPTMNLGWVDPETPDEALKSVVLHEWGHALGLLHEHNHPEARISWNKAAVYADLEGHPNYWSKEKIDFNVFRKFEESEVVTTEFDHVSVMIYPIRPGWTMNDKGFMPSSTLSSGDIATIKRLYPMSRLPSSGD